MYGTKGITQADSALIERYNAGDNLAAHEVMRIDELRMYGVRNIDAPYERMNSVPTNVMYDTVHKEMSYAKYAPDKTLNTNTVTIRDGTNVSTDIKIPEVDFSAEFTAQAQNMQAIAKKMASVPEKLLSACTCQSVNRFANSVSGLQTSMVKQADELATHAAAYKKA